MRGASWLLLLAIFAILGWLGFSYKAQRRALDQQAPAKPTPLPLDVTASAPEWTVRKTDGKGRTIVEIWAKNFKQTKDSSNIDLEQVRLHLFHKDGDQFDLVESPSATFQPTDILFSSDL